MKRCGNILALFGQLLEFGDGFSGVEGDQLDPFLLKDLPGLLGDFHHSGCAAADHQDRRAGRDYGLKVFGRQDVSPLSPPICEHGIAEDQTIAAVGLAVDNNVSKLIRINMHVPASRD